MIRRTLVLALVLASLHAGQVWAQDAPSRPYKGLFGGSQSKPDKPDAAKQTLALTVDLQGGHDDDVLSGTGSQPLDPRYQVGGTFAASSLGLSYSGATAGRALTFGARASTEFRYSPPALTTLTPTQDGSVTLGLMKTLGILTFNVQQSATYTPYRRLMFFPRLPQVEALPDAPRPVVAPSSDFAISTDRVLGLSSDAGVTIQLGKRSAFNVAYRRLLTDYSGLSGNVLDESLGGAFRYGLTRYAALRLGYAYRESSYSGVAGAAPVASTNFDGGIEYRRPLSLTRKTSLSFSSGSSGTSDGYRTVYAATGAATLAHEIGRSWGTSLSYSRELSFLDGYPRAFLSDGISTQVSGYISQRLDLSINGGYSDGNSARAAVGQSANYGTYTGAARARLAFSRYGLLYVQYFYYQYRFRNFDMDVRGLPPSMERSGIRGGITLWLPLLQ